MMFDHIRSRRGLRENLVFTSRPAFGVIEGGLIEGGLTIEGGDDRRKDDVNRLIETNDAGDVTSRVESGC